MLCFYSQRDMTDKTNLFGVNFINQPNIRRKRNSFNNASQRLSSIVCNTISLYWANTVVQLAANEFSFLFYLFSFLSHFKFLIFPTSQLQNQLRSSKFFETINIFFFLRHFFLKIVLVQQEVCSLQTIDLQCRAKTSSTKRNFGKNIFCGDFHSTLFW